MIEKEFKLTLKEIDKMENSKNPQPAYNTQLQHPTHGLANFY